MNDENSYFHKAWLSALAWAFIAIILFDFIIAPGIVLGMIKSGIAIAPWKPLTMDGTGTFYLAIGAILGVNRWQRGRLEVENAKSGYDFGKDDNQNPDDIGPPL
jgi:hypothetical protein